jgi:hypothetical protein
MCLLSRYQWRVAGYELWVTNCRLRSLHALPTETGVHRTRNTHHASRPYLITTGKYTAYPVDRCPSLGTQSVVPA